MRALVASAALAALLAGCSDEVIHPLDSGATSTTADTSSSTGDTSSSSGSGGPVFRQVFTRNPWGGPPGNLIVDGDFEFSAAPYSGQYGWLLFDKNAAQKLLTTETGGICRTGLRCGMGLKTDILYGEGASAPDMTPMHATVYAKPITPPADGEDLLKFCRTTISGYASDCATGDIFGHLVAAGVPAPDGYCELDGDVMATNRSICLYLTLQRDAIVDSATLLPVPASSPSPTPESLESIPAGDREAVRALTRQIRARQRFDRGQSMPEENPKPIDRR